MTVSQLIDLLWKFEGDKEVVFLSPQDTPLKLDEVWQSYTKDRIVIDLVEPD